jgi:hypothetical protein
MAANAVGASQGKASKAAIINGSAITILVDADRGGVLMVISLPDALFVTGQSISFTICHTFEANGTRKAT